MFTQYLNYCIKEYVSPQRILYYAILNVCKHNNNREFFFINASVMLVAWPTVKDKI